MSTNLNINTHAPEQRAHAGHTSLPWHPSAFFNDDGTNCNAGAVAAISGAGGEPICSLHRRNPDTDANAALIVRAVNSHAALVEALCDMLSCADAGDMDALANASADARAALALAEGGAS